MARHALVFGGQGAIGTAVVQRFRDEGWQVTTVFRRGDAAPDAVRWQPLDDDAAGLQALVARAPFDAVVWAQGANCNDSAYSFDAQVHLDLYRANVLYVLQSLHQLLARGAFALPARLCVISSIWQNLARQNKLSYCVTKAAVQGLVLSLANDMGKDGHLVNAVLPGVLDTPMTRRNLSPAQVDKVASSTQFNRLPTVGDVAAATWLLCSDSNTGITGQFVTVDLGYSSARVI